MLLSYKCISYNDVCRNFLFYSFLLLLCYINLAKQHIHLLLLIQVRVAGSSSFSRDTQTSQPGTREMPERDIISLASLGSAPGPSPSLQTLCKSICKFCGPLSAHRKEVSTSPFFRPRTMVLKVLILHALMQITIVHAWGHCPTRPGEPNNGWLGMSVAQEVERVIWFSEGRWISGFQSICLWQDTNPKILCNVKSPEATKAGIKKS